MDGRSPSPRNSFKELYYSSPQAMIRRKEEMVSELKTLPPCTISDCQDHKIPSTSVEEEIILEPSLPENKIKTVSKPNKKNLAKTHFYHKVHDFNLKAHCHPPIKDRSIERLSALPLVLLFFLKSRPSLQAQVPKPRKSESQIEDRRMLAHPRDSCFSKSSVKSCVKIHKRDDYPPIVGRLW
ncbi:hypothetical protein TNCV_3042141 [Trichonephila clavipes]|nr:hypothetical protein TNCV_3042141 [Trichonephila clavipes]